MDYITIIAFVLGVAIVGAFFIIKDYKLIKADKIASQIIAVVQSVLAKYADEIKAYDKMNGTTYFEDLTKIMKRIEDLEADDTITPVEFALAVIELYEDITAILENVNLKDKVLVKDITV